MPGKALGSGLPGDEGVAATRPALRNTGGRFVTGDCGALLRFVRAADTKENGFARLRSGAGRLEFAPMHSFQVSKFARWSVFVVPSNLRRLAVLTLLVGGLMGYSTLPIAAQTNPTHSVTVTKTFDGEPFTYEVVGREVGSGYHILQLRFPSPVQSVLPQNNTVPARLFLPDQLSSEGAKRPAVICLPILNGDEDLSSAVCSVLVQRGIPALMFTLPYYKERGGSEGPRVLEKNLPMFLSGLEQTLADIRRVTDLLASRPEVDAQRLGVTGISLGGILAGTAGGMDPRLQRVGMLLAGGDLPAIIGHARETRSLNALLQRLSAADRAKVDAQLKALDPLTLAPALRERAAQGRVLMINAGQDEVIPPDCTRKLATALGIADRVVWFDGLGHYTAMAELPRALRLLGDFFAQDLPANAVVAAKPISAQPLTPMQQVVGVVQQAMTMITVEPAPRRCHFLEAEFSIGGANGKPIEGRARLVVGNAGRFSLRCQLPMLGEVIAGQGSYPWLCGGPEQTVFAGTLAPVTNQTAWSHLTPENLISYRMVAGLGATLALVPDLPQKWIQAEVDSTATDGQVLRVAARDSSAGSVRLTLAKDALTPTRADLDFGDLRGHIRILGWQTNTLATDELFEPPFSNSRREVPQAELYRMFSAVLNFAGELLNDQTGKSASPAASELTVVARDPAGHGLLAQLSGKKILMVKGTPEQMGAAHGALLGETTRRLVERVVYGVGAADTIQSGNWFPDVLGGIQQRVTPYLPARFFAETDALAAAAQVPPRDMRYANLFPERFHCSGVALRGGATVGGQVLHARVLDYMRDIGLQHAATVMVFQPQDHHAWMSLSYAGFLGTVTAMNERGLAIGEMGGRGEGLWDGLPMSFLLRDVMERAATVEEALAIIQSTPRTCEYYYVVSDKTGAMRGLHCLPDKMEVLQPGQQHPLLPEVPEDAVFMSAGVRAETLSRRLRENYGKIDAPRLMEIIKRPVAMESNLHNAIFAPETLEMWFADAGRTTPACDEPYTRVKLDELLKFYETAMTANNGEAVQRVGSN